MKGTVILTIYVPKPGSFMHSTIKPGSGVVGVPLKSHCETCGLEVRDGSHVNTLANRDHTANPIDERIEISYEGNRYGAENMKTFEEKLLHAADRLISRYPTISKAWVKPEDLVAVGRYDGDTMRVLDIFNQAALDAWLA